MIRLAMGVLTSIWISNVVWASDAHSHGHEHEIPWEALYPQFLNFFVVICLAVIFGRKQIAAFFQQREAKYSDLVTRAEAAKGEAEDAKQRITERMIKLNQSASDNMQKVRSEATELKNRIIVEAQELAERIEKETRRSAEFEIERAKIELRGEMAREALLVAREALGRNLDMGKQKKLQHEFVEKIQVVS